MVGESYSLGGQTLDKTVTETDQTIPAVEEYDWETHSNDITGAEFEGYSDRFERNRTTSSGDQERPTPGCNEDGKYLAELGGQCVVVALEVWTGPASEYHKEDDCCIQRQGPHGLTRD